ncbi:cupin domain-containing protein [Jiangella asiatica]|uniref:Transcription regulator HTH AraC- type ligand binding domain-containing protein n=1 Tax=Jiangella asiatica TaxID=2530372 RepID=A0A4R5DIL6_9ACTN|nr:hypothetical protein [Jiangella asiatica]TDE10615.1 hypothetical protein E1269_11075 [Jiangella asiatica]
MISLPLDQFPVLNSGNLDDVRAKIWQAMGEHPIELVDPTATLRARINGRLIDRISASYLEFGAAVRTEPGEIAFYLMQLVVKGTYHVRQDDEEVTAGAGDVVVLSPDRHLTTWWSADCGVVAYQIRAPHLIGHLGALLERPVTEPLRFDLVLDGRSGPGGTLNRELLRPLARQLNYEESVVNEPARARQLEDMLLSALLRSQPNTYSEVLERELGWPRP